MADYTKEAADILGRWLRHPGISDGAAEVLAAGQLAALLAIEARLAELTGTVSPIRSAPSTTAARGF